MFKSSLGWALLLSCNPHLRPNFFDLLDYVTRRPENWDLKIKKKILRFSGEKRKLQAATMVAGAL